MGGDRYGLGVGGGEPLVCHWHLFLGALTLTRNFETTYGHFCPFLPISFTIS